MPQGGSCYGKLLGSFSERVEFGGGGVEQAVVTGQ